ncbi:hypothetical protein [Nonomuraea sp. NPDC050783]|uniref:hypothetical protein n=1 Tax=Nonomuraea sp. NPDC050783 TaxID=3154634 RepID=UPI0034656F16
MKRLRSFVASGLLLLGAVLAVSTILAPASTGTAAAGHRHRAGPLPVAGLDRILAAVACRHPEVQVDAAELHEVACRSAAGRYTVMTFATSRGESSWLGEAEPYGGTYLVGDRWAVVSTPALLDGLRARLGGRIEGGPGSGPGSHH